MTTAAIFGLTLLLVLDQLGVNLAPLLAGASVAGIAIGFGAQAFVKDLFAGISVLAEDQWRFSDVIDFGESGGVVESITLKVPGSVPLTDAMAVYRMGKFLVLQIKLKIGRANTGCFFHIQVILKMSLRRFKDTR